MFRPKAVSTFVVGSMAAWLTAASATASTIAVPSYFYPGVLWTQMESAYPTVGLSIINPASGPGTAVNADYYGQVTHTRARGLHVLGYVATGYGARAAADVKADIDRYFAWYPIDGIFFDEASNNCTVQPYYVDVNNYAKGKGAAVTVLNPGTSTAECYTSAGDILLTFEGTYATYQTWALSGWEFNYPPSKFWHLVYQTPQVSVPSAVTRASGLRAGWVYITPDDLPNPWDTLPAGTYWTDELAAVQSTSSTPTATVRPRATATATARPTARPTATATATTASGTLLSQGRPATASSAENVDTGASLAVDGNTATRWSSAFSDPQWITVDLGTSASLTRVVLNWEAAYGRAYQIQVSPDNITWTTIVNATAGDGGIDDLALSAGGRYVRMYGTARGTAYGYSLWEMQVYGTAGSATPTATARATATATTRPTATATARATATATARPAGGVLVSQGKSATASSTENAGTTANLAVDGNTGTRWSSAFSDPQWILVDLGATTSISRVVLNWEAAYGRAYQIQTSANATTWTTIVTETAGNGGIDDLTVSGSGRYVRVYGTARGTGWGYSLWELQVFN